jgi:signal transduction histidine kinase/CheY-like chemotaxis protein
MAPQYSIHNDEGKEQNLVQFLGITALMVAIFAILDYFIYSPATGYVLIGLSIVLFVLRFLLLNNRINYNLCSTILGFFTVFYIVPFFAFFSGGLFSPSIPWLAIVPVGGTFLFGLNKKIFLFTILSILVLLVFAILEATHFVYPSFRTNQNYIVVFISLSCLLLLLLFLTWLFEKQKTKALRSLEDEQSLFLKHTSQLHGTIYQFQLFKDGTYQFNFISDGIKDMLGFTAEEVKNNPKQIFRFIHPDDFLGLKKSLSQSRKTLQKWIYEGRMQMPGKETTYVKGTARPERQADGSTIWYGYTYDVTDEKKAGQALAESQSNFKQITDTINDVFYLYDIVNKKYLFISPNCKEILGVPDTFFYEGGSYNKTHAYEEDKKLLIDANDIVDAGKSYEIEYRIVIGGQIRWVLEKSFPIKDNMGTTIQNSGILTNITERKLSEQKLLESQNYVKQISTTINDMFFLYDSIQKKYLFMSPNCSTVLGVPDTFFYEGKDYTANYVLEADKQKLLDAYERMSIDMEYNLDYRVLINGKMKWLNEKSYAIKDDNGAFVKMSGIVTDITARKVTEEKLMKSQRAFEEAQELAHIGSWEVSFFDSSMDWSKEAYSVFELDATMPKEKVYESFQKKIHPDDLKIVEQEVSAISKTKTINSVEFRIVCNNGEVKYLFGIAEAILSEKNKKLIGLKGTVQDITKQRLAAMAKSNFLSTMSHEIRTPINGVIGISNLLMAEDLTPVQKEYVNTLNFSAQHLSTIVSDILDFSKIESGNFTFEKVSFNMEQVCNNIFKLFQAQAAEKNITYTFSPHHIEGFSLYGDYVRLSQVLTNLLSNAVKFTHKGSVELSYKPIEENDKTITIQFMVKDTGIGITGIQQKRIFESFLQADDSVTRKYGGTGLGLTICKKFVELQGGKIYLDSVHGKGSTFIVELAFDKHSFTNEAITKTPITELDKLSLKGMKILVAEDNKINAMVLTRFLTKWDIESHVAEDGQKALDMVNSKEFDLILMDLQMPVMDGRTATTQIRQSSNQMVSKIPIVALTADALIDSQRALLRSGFNDCVTKPFSPEMLFKMLKKYHESKS